MPARSWTSHAPRVYDALMKPVDAFLMRRMRARLWAQVPRAGRGLEIGAGSGAGAEHRASHAGVIGTDISAQMLERARTRDATTPLVAADVQALPFAAGTFDWVAGSLLFCEVPEPARGFAEVGRVLRAGGTLHLVEHVLPPGAILAAAARALTRVTAPLFGEHWDRRTEETVAASGFTIERAERMLRGGLVHLVARRPDNAERDR